MTDHLTRHRPPEHGQPAPARRAFRRGLRPIRFVAPAHLDDSVPGMPFDLVDLQRVAGNAAVGQLLQRQPVPQPKPTVPKPAPAPAKTTGAAATAGTAAAAPAKPPAPNLSDARIKWISDLPATVRTSIDKSTETIQSRVTKVEADIAKLRADLAAAKTDEAQKAANDAIAKLTQEMDKLSQKYAPPRIALMDYLGCQLGGDPGVERYFKSLVNWGDGDLWVHPEAARRLTRVRNELAKEGVPMPSSDNGFALRGRHLHGKKESESPGMMTHSLGVAIDWEAYKNVHIKDESLMALITAVTGKPHHLQMPDKEVKTVEALGEKAMGNKLSKDQQSLVDAGGDALIEKIGTEFDRLEADSDKFRDSLGIKKEDLMPIHNELVPIGQEIKELKKQLTEVGPKARPAIQAKIDKLQEQGAKKMADMKAKLDKLFKPWLDALKTAADEKRKKSETLLAGDAKTADKLKGKKLDDVITNEGLKSRAQGVAAGTAGQKKELDALLKEANGSVGKVQAVRKDIAGARAYLDKSGKPDEKTEWADKLARLEERAVAVVGRGAAVTSEVRVLRGSAPDEPAATPKSGLRKLRSAKEFAAWETEIAKHEGQLAKSEATLKAATDKAPKDAVAAAYKLRDDRKVSEEIRKNVTGDAWTELQNLKGEVWQLDRTANRLMTDASFMFIKADVRDPGVAQLTGVLEQNEYGKKADIGGGGFFGTATSAKQAAAKIAAAGGKEKLPARAGFSKRFFQVMVKFGFEPAARWRTADSMHFQLAGLANSIVPTKECTEPPPDAESKAKTDEEKQKIAKDRASAAAARARGEAYSKGAEESGKAWAKEAH